MENHDSDLREQLFKLNDQDTTPEEALQLFSYPYFYPDALNNATVAIFCGYIQFIIQRTHDGCGSHTCIEGIWEKLLRKTMIYSQNFSEGDVFVNVSFSNNIFSNAVMIDVPGIMIWLNNVLCSPYTKCPNPYIRLELFRLIRIFLRNEDYCLMNWTGIYKKFIPTVSEIQPHCLYHRGDENDSMFCLADMEWIFQMFSEEKDFPLSISKVITHDYINNSNRILIESKESIFITHCIQAIGVYAVMAGCNHDSDKQITEILTCFRILNNVVRLGGKVTPVVQLLDQWIVTFPPYQQYVIDTLQKLSAAVMNIHITDSDMPLSYLRDIFVRNLIVSTKTYILPRLLLSRQAGFTSVQPRLLLLKNIDRHANKRRKREFNFDLSMHWMETFIEEYMHLSERDSRTNYSRNRAFDSNYWEDSSSSDDFSDESTNYGQNSSDLNTSMSNDSSDETDSSTSDASSEDIDD